jgi:Type II secretion system (T2SS), protein N
MRRWFALAAGLALGLVLLLPARLLLPAPPLAAASIDGTIWRAQLTDASLGGARLGGVALAVDAAALLRGRLGWRLAGGLDGQLWRSLSGSGGDGLSGRMAGAPVAGLPVTGASLAGVSLAIDGQGLCQSASGQVTVELAAALAGQSALSGALRCEAGRMLLPLASSDGRVRLELSGDARGWQSRLIVNGAGLSEAAALNAAGLRREADALVQTGEAAW